MIKYLLDEEATDERVYAFEWERNPHSEEKATSRRKELPRELLQTIWGFALDSSIASDLFIRGSGRTYVRGITKVPDMLRTNKWFASQAAAGYSDYCPTMSIDLLSPYPN